MKKLLLVASAIALITGCASDQNATYRGTTGAMGSGTDAGYGIGIAPTQQGAGAVQLTSSAIPAEDLRFLQRAAEYNQTDIQLGQAIVQKSDNSQLKTFGQRLVDDHTTANQQLIAIVAQTGATIPTMPNADQQQMLDRLNGLSGNDFNNAAIQNSIQVQERQANLYSQAAGNLHNSAVKSYAQQNLGMVQDELMQARQLSGPAPTVSTTPPQSQ